MNALKKRPVAIAITVVVILAAVLGGSHRSLAAQRNRVMTLYETGTGSDGSVLDDQNRQMEICANLSAVALRCQPGSKELTRLQDALTRYDTKDAAKRAEAYQEARAAADELLDMLEQMDSLSEQDAAYVASFRSQLSSYDYTIARNGYNAAARNFNERVLGAFPANVLGPITGIRPLEVFE